MPYNELFTTLAQAALSKYGSQSSLIEGKQNVLSSCIFMFGGS